MHQQKKAAPRMGANTLFGFVYSAREINAFAEVVVKGLHSQSAQFLGRIIFMPGVPKQGRSAKVGC